MGKCYFCSCFKKLADNCQPAWATEASNPLGKCVRYPPKVGNSASIATNKPDAFPIVKSDDYCFEYIGNLPSDS